MTASGLACVEVVDHPPLRNLRLFDRSGSLRDGGWPNDLPGPVAYGEDFASLRPEGLDCLVATSDIGGMQLLREWNARCVEAGRPFLPVVLQDLIGYVGPFVVPGETACFECLRARQNANMDDPLSQRAAEFSAAEGQAVVGFHPVMATMLGAVAAMELVKHYGIRAPLSKPSTLIEVNMLTSRMEPRRVLKIPRCRVCGTSASNPSLNDRKTFYAPYPR